MDGVYEYCKCLTNALGFEIPEDSSAESDIQQVINDELPKHIKQLENQIRLETLEISFSKAAMELSSTFAALAHATRQDRKNIDKATIEKIAELAKVGDELASLEESSDRQRLVEAQLYEVDC